MDREKILAYCKKYEVDVSDNDEVFWRGIHKARTGAKDMPRKERLKSVAWLRARNSSHLMDSLTGEDEAYLKSPGAQAFAGCIDP
jgi:hypothetical protein